jgi:hypothetical protein
MAGRLASGSEKRKCRHEAGIPCSAARHCPANESAELARAATAAVTAAAIAAAATAASTIAAATAATAATTTATVTAAAAAAATTTVAAATATAATTKAAAATTALLLTRFVHDQRAAFERVAIERADRILRGFGAAHRDECETARTTGLAIGHDTRLADLAVSGEQLRKLRVGGPPGQISDVNLGRHQIILETQESNIAFRGEP